MFYLKKFTSLFFALLISLLILIFNITIENSPFKGGKKEYYINSKSSSSLIKNHINLKDIPFINGYASFYDSVENVGEFVDKSLSKFNAVIIKTEFCGDTLSLYCYSSNFNGGLLLFNKCVNLHIAIKNNSVAMGTPVIFGGY